MLTKILSRFFTSKEDVEKLKKVVIPSFVLHGVAAILGLVLILVMTRNLGTAEYGVYSYAFAVISVLVMLSVNGFVIATIRETSSFLAKGQHGLWKGFHNWALRNVLLTGILFAGLSALFLWSFTYIFHLIKETPYTMPVIYCCSAIPFLCLMSYYTALLLGRHSPVAGLASDNIVKPTVFLALLIINIFIFKNINAVRAIFLATISIAVAMLYSIMAFYQRTKLKGITAEYDKSKWRKMFWHFFLLSGFNSLDTNIDILMLGIFASESVVGVFSTTQRVSAALYVFMAIMNRLAAAPFSHLHTTNEKEKLQSTITKITRWTSYISLPVFIVIILFSKPILSFFGKGFAEGQTALIILCVGQMFAIITGPVGNLSIMTGNEKINIRYTFVMIIVSIILNVILIPLMGINGAAIAAAFVNILWNCAMFAAVKSKTGLSTWIFG